jgi:hypothetical protein
MYARRVMMSSDGLTVRKGRVVGEGYRLFPYINSGSGYPSERGKETYR